MLSLFLCALPTQVAESGQQAIEVRVDPEDYPNGRFARVHDPEGNPIELWEPRE